MKPEASHTSPLVASSVKDWFDARAIEGERSRAVRGWRFTPKETDQYTTELVSAVMQTLGKSIENKDILELGSGVGCFTTPLSSLARTLVGIDISRKMLERIVASGDLNDHTPLVQASADALPFADNSFDVLFESQVLMHVNDQSFQQIFQEGRRVLRPDGFMFFSGVLSQSGDRETIHPYFTRRPISSYACAASNVGMEIVQQIDTSILGETTTMFLIR